MGKQKKNIFLNLKYIAKNKSANQWEHASWLTDNMYERDNDQSSQGGNQQPGLRQPHCQQTVTLKKKEKIEKEASLGRNPWTTERCLCMIGSKNWLKEHVVQLLIDQWRTQESTVCIHRGRGGNESGPRHASCHWVRTEALTQFQP